MSGFNELNFTDYIATGRVHTVDLLTGRRAVTSSGYGAPVSGFATLLKTGLWPPRNEVFLAVYSRANTLWLRVEMVEFDLRNEATELRLSTPYPFVRRLIVKRNRAEIVNLTWWMRRFEFSDWAPEGDFVEWVLSIAHNPSEILRCTLWWDAASRGLDLTHPDVLRRLEEQYQLSSGVGTAGDNEQ